MRFHRTHNIAFEDWLALLIVLIFLYVLFRIFDLGKERRTSNWDYVFGIGVPLWLIAFVISLLSSTWQFWIWTFLMPVCVVSLAQIFELPVRRAVLLAFFILGTGMAAFPVAQFAKARLDRADRVKLHQPLTGTPLLDDRSTTQRNGSSSPCGWQRFSACNPIFVGKPPSV